nr:MAG: hypothetical protein [Bacteriophage sp.]
MEVHNNFSPLAFRKKESKATYEKWYAFGKNYAIPASANTLTPFQFTELNIQVFDPDTIEVEAVNEETGEPTKTGVYVSFDVMPEHGGVLYVSPGKNSFREALPQGTYRARFTICDEVYISTPFCVIPGIETSSKYLLIEYWNDEKIAYPGGFITTGANNDFRYQMYVPATICKPKYEFEEELTKRAGYKFLELQTSTKVYAFTFVAPEFICDAMRLIRLSDYIRISHDGEYYNALNFEFDVDWQEQLYLAAVDCQFETDSIIQKLPSFNRRDKASFYNALLANIDTPIMFSPDTVGLYYKEYRETEPVVKGKLIRELSPIDLIDENTTIAVDLGTGEARKFNLYRMLQDYISKSHEDATNFLLHLRGGATFGDDISGSAAHINSAGDAKFNDVDADAVSADSVDAGSWLSVGNTAFTVNKSGKTDTGELTARGKAYLTEDVYTGGGTGTITKDGQLKYLSAIIQQFLSSPTFVSGFLGEGFKIWFENGNWHIECDNLTVRQTMNIFELLIQKIRSVNGALVVSQSNGKLSEVKEVGEQYKLTTGEEFPTFQEGDLVRCQTFAGYQGAGLTFDFTQFAKYDYSGGAFDSSLIDVTPDSISFNLNDTGNSGFAFYKFSESSPTPIEIPSFTLTLEGGYPGMMAFAAGLDSNDSPVEGVGVLLQNGDNVIPAIKSEQGIHNFAITITGDSGHGNGKVTVKQKKAAGSAPNNSLVKFYWVEVKAVDGTSFFADKAEFNGVIPAVGDEVVQMGNTKNTERQALIYITAQESGKPYIEILDGVKTKSLSGTNRTRLGDLSNIQDSAFPEGQQPSGYGLYAMNCFLKGIFILRNGKSIEQEFSNIATELAAIPGKIELAIRSMKVADVNLLYDSNHKLNANPYQMGSYKYDVHLEAGKTYTLTVCYKCADSDVIRAYNNPSYGWIGTLPKSAEETVLSQPITPINPDGAYFYFYKFPQQESTETYIKWAVITEGSVGVANWIPSATERKLNIGGENLMLQSQQALDGSGAQYAFQLSKAWTDLKGKTLTISFDYAYSNLKMGSSQRFGLEKAIYKSGTSQYYYIGAFKYVDSTSPTADKGRYVHTIKVPEDIEDSLDTDIIAYIQLGAGSVCRINNFQIEIGDTATGWKPAPKDSFTESKKYTDTQILAVDGKIELSVKTKVENLGIGANNLYSYTSSLLNTLYPSPTIERQMSLHGFYLVGSQGNGGAMRIPNIIPPIPGKYTVSGWIKGSQNTPVGFTIDVCDSENVIVRSTADNQWSYFKHTFNVTKNTEEQKDVYNFVDIERIDWAYIWIKDFKVEAGEIATAWSPNFQDAVYKGAEYTNSQISVVEGKITSTVEKINTVDGRVTGLASRVEQTEKSITSVVGDIGVINSTTNRHISKRIDLRGWDNNKFFPLVISIPVYHKTRVEISRPLDAGYGKPSYGTHDGGFSMNLTFEMSGSGWGSLPAVTNIFDYTKAWTSAGAKIVVDLGQITETSTCRMGIRGGSMYDVTVDDTINPNAINVYQTDYHGTYNTSFPVRTDGTEPFRTYGYYTEIKQTQESIALTANKVDDQGRRLSAAELTLSSDHAKLSVVEQTANSANSLAGTANGKAEAADGRVTATQNGLVNTGINITSRKIVLKSDNVLFQNNAGQQTAAINANGKLTANAIEVGEVVAGGFAAQRITTGNLTVTDGAVIGGMTITGGVLTGKAINIQDGAKIGNFTIESGILSANGMVAGMQMRLSNNLMEISSSGLRIDHNSGGYAVNVTGNGRCYMQGVESYRKFGVYEFAGATQWKAPGVHFACTISSAAKVRQKWGNPSISVSASKLSTGRYTVRFTGVHSQGFIPMVMALNATKWVNACVEDIVSRTQFTVKLMDVNTGMVDSDFAVYICGFV